MHRRRISIAAAAVTVALLALASGVTAATNRSATPKLSHMRFEPSGMTNDPDIRAAKSIVDYIFRWFGKKFLTPEQQEEAGILSPEVKAMLADRYANGGAGTVTAEPGEAPPPGQTALFNSFEDAIECNRCGGRMVRAGTCYTCRDCGTNTGCS